MFTRPNNSPSQLLIVIGIILLGVVITVVLFVFKPEAERKPVEYQPPQVEYIVIHPQTIHIPVNTQGTIQATTQINLAAEVAGKVSSVSPQLNAGAYFKKGDVLLSIDDSDYSLAIIKAEALVAAAKQVLARTEAEAEQARLDIKRIGRRTDSLTAYALREPQLKEAQANLKAARADLAIAKLQLERTKIIAPFDGRVISKHVDVGQYVSPGMAVAEIYSTERVEVRLPLTQSQVSLVNIPAMYLQKNGSKTSDVDLMSEFGGKQWHWLGQVVRTESVIDSRNRLVYVVAEVNESSEDVTKPPLTSGMYVKAIIKGKQLDNIFVLPRDALRYGQEIWLANENDELVKQPVKVLYKDDRFVYISEGLQAQQKVITGALDYAVQGMKLGLSEGITIQQQKAAK